MIRPTTAPSSTTPFIPQAPCGGGEAHKRPNTLEACRVQPRESIIISCGADSLESGHSSAPCPAPCAAPLRSACRVCESALLESRTALQSLFRRDWL